MMPPEDPNPRVTPLATLYKFNSYRVPSGSDQVTLFDDALLVYSLASQRSSRSIFSSQSLLSPAVRSDIIPRSSAIGGVERRSPRLYIRPRRRSQSPQLTQKHHMLNAKRKSVSDRTICVHGNFLSLKYRFFESSMGKRYIMSMQSLVGRLLAHYVFWKDNSQSTSEVCKRMLIEDWSSSQYVWNFPLQLFDFVGIAEDSEAEMRKGIELYHSQDVASVSAGARNARQAVVAF